MPRKVSRSKAVRPPTPAKRAGVRMRLPDSGQRSENSVAHTSRPSSSSSSSSASPLPEPTCSTHEHLIARSAMLTRIEILGMREADPKAEAPIFQKQDQPIGAHKS